MSQTCVSSRNSHLTGLEKCTMYEKKLPKYNKCFALLKRYSRPSGH